MTKLDNKKNKKKFSFSFLCVLRCDLLKRKTMAIPSKIKAMDFYRFFSLHPSFTVFLHSSFASLYFALCPSAPPNDLSLIVSEQRSCLIFLFFFLVLPLI
jgi:hypothetical protein